MDAAAFLVAAVNGALAHLDQPPITSLDQPTHAARTAKALWMGVLDSCQAAHPWNFAEVSFRPAAESATPDAAGWYSHPLEDDCLQVVSVTGLGPGGWKVVAPLAAGAPMAGQARRLLARALAPEVIASWRIVNAGLWSPLFREYYEFSLAAKLAGPVGRNADKAPALRQEARLVLMMARRRDGQEAAPQEAPRQTSWVAARRRGAR